MPIANSGAQQPTDVALRCPRCWYPAEFVPLGGQFGLTWRCVRCEWKFALGAPAIVTPAVPLSTVTAANTTGTVIAVTITGGTLTAVVINGSTVGAADGTYLMQVGATISITYSIAPTWVWALPAISANVLAGGVSLPFANGGGAFSAGQVLIVDPAGNPDMVPVTGTPTNTAVPVAALNAAHLSGVLVTVTQLTVAHPSVEALPQTAY